MASIDGTTTTYYEKNHLGSIIRITSTTGAIVDEYSYTVFGKAYRKNTNGIYKPVSGSNDSPIWNTRLFTWREYDREVSLYYLRARYYDANLGRFVSRDPIGMSDDINLYRYVANNPMKYVDRMGLEKILIILWVDKDGIIPVINSDKTIDSCTEGSTYVCQRYYTLMREFLSNWTDMSNISVQVATDFSKFDNLVNEKKRESIYVITHGDEESVYLSNNNPPINAESLKQDTQTQEQRENLSKTELYIFGCNTGYSWISNLWSDPIAQDIQDHYGFEATYAPDNYMWGNDGRITDSDTVLRDWKIKQIPDNQILSGISFFLQVAKNSRFKHIIGG